MRPFTTLEEMIVWASQDVRPVKEMTVPQAAAEIPRQLNNRGSYVGPWRNEKTPYMIEPAECLTDPDLNAVIFSGPAQAGKALALDTPIPTPSGWTTMGALRPGDEVFAKDGTPTLVEAVSPVMYGHDCYRVEFDDGSFIVADAEHLWEVSNVDRRGAYITTTEEIRRGFRRKTKRGDRALYAIECASALTLPDRVLPIDPYVLGVYLGDGSCRSGYITVGDSDLRAMIEELGKRGFEAAVYSDPRKVWTLNLKRADDEKPFRTILREAGLWQAEKRIPKEYLRASRRQRVELLRGLMDTDGTTCKRRRGCEFNTSLPSLARSVRELLTSLGYKTRVKARIPKLYGVEHKPSFRVCFTAYDFTDVFSLPRKRARERSACLVQSPRQGQTTRRWITRVDRVASVPVRCIRVAHPSHLFLAGEAMIPTHNTDSLLLNYVFQTFITNPLDMMIVSPSQAAGRDFSERRVKRLIRHNPALAEKVLPGRQNQNVFDIKFSSGTMLTISWPTISELSGKPIPIVLLTDYDRMPENVEGEGSPFDLARTRTRTFGRSAMTLAESSPSFTVETAEWTRSSPHEAPPTKGVLALYNRGDRRRYYWRCFKCETPFLPSFSLLTYPDTTDPMEAGAGARMRCPHCTVEYDHDGTISPTKSEMNLRRARWIPDGGRWLDDGSVMRPPVVSDIASFWFPGVCAEFSTWAQLVAAYVRADQEFQRTGSEEALKVTVNVDQGDVYIPIAMRTDRSTETLQGRAQPLSQGVVPFGARFLVASIDVQKRRFVVQVHAFGRDGERWVIDRFDIKESARKPEVEGAPPPRAHPGSFLEDWELLIAQVIERTYPLEDDPERVMRVLHTVCDSGGEEGVTAKAYEFWRSLMKDKQDRRHHTRFTLVKGGSTKDLPRVQRVYPDSERKDRRAAARGEVPVLLLNPITVKDMTSALLDRDKPGGDRFVPSDWLPAWFYKELTAEVRTSKGWMNPNKARNEAFDLLTYAIALALTHPVNIEHLDWNKPPLWAEEWDRNTLIISANQASVAPEAASPPPSAKKIASKLL